MGDARKGEGARGLKTREKGRGRLAVHRKEEKWERASLQSGQRQGQRQEIACPRILLNSLYYPYHLPRPCGAPIRRTLTLHCRFRWRDARGKVCRSSCCRWPARDVSFGGGGAHVFVFVAPSVSHDRDNGFLPLSLSSFLPSFIAPSPTSFSVDSTTCTL